MTIGSKVRVKQDAKVSHHYIGKVGTITKITEGRYRFFVEFDVGGFINLKEGEFELMPKFNVGDKVKAIGDLSEIHIPDDAIERNSVGVIIDILEGGELPYAVDFDNGDIWWFNDKYLEPATTISVAESPDGPFVNLGVVNDLEITYESVPTRSYNNSNQPFDFSFKSINELPEATVYISGPMTGKKEYNFPLFDAVEEALLNTIIELDGVEHEISNVINPAQLDRELGLEDENGDPLSWHDFLRRDITIISEAVNEGPFAIILFDDWQNSRGANFEMYVATQMGIPVFEYQPIIHPNLGEVDFKLVSADLSVPFEAQNIVLGARRYQYGHPLDNFLFIADLWTSLLSASGKLAEGATIDVRDVAMLMNQVKVAREYNAPKRDNQVDISGYAYAYEEAKGEAQRRGISEDRLLNDPTKEFKSNYIEGANESTKPA